jgi:hypothetical protein
MEFIDYLVSVDATGVVVLMLAAALTGLLFGVGTAWRGVQREMREAPVQAALRRLGGGTLTAREVRNAEVRCALCPARGSCAGRLRRGEPLPPECPNRALFLSPAA